MQNKDDKRYSAKEIKRLIKLLNSDADISDDFRSEIEELLISEEYADIVDIALMGIWDETKDLLHSKEEINAGIQKTLAAIAHRHGDFPVKPSSVRATPAASPSVERTPKHVPYYRRTVFKVAAILIPFLLLAGGIWLMLDNSLQAQAEPLYLAVKAKPAAMEQPAIEAEPVVEPITPGVESVPEITVPEAVTYDLVVSSSRGKHRHVRLPDRTTVLLQGGSRLLYSSAGREAYLEGEAYFEVTKGHRQPFRVKTGELTVNVTGTRFNVQAWTNGEQQLVDLIDGSVDVQVDGQKIRLEPMEELKYQPKDRSLKLIPFDGNGWWNEPICFTEVTLTHILEEIENYYDIRILGKETISDTALYTIKFDRVSTVEQMLDIMHELLEYRKDANGITVNRRETDNR